MTTVALRRKTMMAMLGLASGLLAACHDDQVEHAHVTKEAAATPMPPNHPAMPGANAPMAGAPGADEGSKLPPNHPPIPGMVADSAGGAPAAPPGMKGDVPMPPKPAGDEGLSWTLPAGWNQTLTGGIRYATLTPPGAGKIDASVVVLPGPAGGELANVNRWRGQIGLAPLDSTTLPSQRKTVDTLAGPVALYDFSSEGTAKTRIVAGLAVVNGNSWFFKLTGDADAVGSALPAFTTLVSSLHPATAHAN